MKIQFAFGRTETELKTVSLDKMLAQILRTFQPVAVSKSSFIVNDVPADFYVGTNARLLEKTLATLLISIISRSHNSCIRISARRYNNVVLLRIKDCSRRFSFDLEEGLQTARLLAERLGGCIVANDLRKTEAAITFTFVNSRCAA